MVEPFLISEMTLSPCLRKKLTSGLCWVLSTTVCCSKDFLEVSNAWEGVLKTTEKASPSRNSCCSCMYFCLHEWRYLNTLDQIFSLFELRGFSSDY